MKPFSSCNRRHSKVSAVPRTDAAKAARKLVSAVAAAEPLEPRVLLSTSWALTTLTAFNGTDGEAPEAGVTLDASGNLYGTTSEGGGSVYGNVFEITSGGLFEPRVDFGPNSGANGEGPEAGVTLDASGNLYGTTVGGGASDDGTVFELTSGGVFKTLATFSGTNGTFPEASVTLDASGNLYGTTSEGGASNDGTVFEITSGGVFKTLATFNGTNGANPYAGVTLDASGNLYGTTYEGGASNDGTVFELTSGGRAFKTLTTFNGTNGAFPEAGVTLDASGNLYGTTAGGGASNDGMAFEVTSGGVFKTLATFSGTNGAFPEAGVTLDASGNLYGTTLEGGASNEGTVFEITSGGVFKTLAAFNNTNGAVPEAGVTLDASGNLYGTTYAGGASHLGTVFELSPVQSTSFSNVIANGGDYGGTATVAGTIRGDSQVPTGSVSLRVDGGPTRTATIDPSSGDFSASFGGLSAGQHTYDVSYAGGVHFAAASDATGSFTVSKAPLTITADHQNEVYGAALPTLTYTLGGFVNGDTSSVVSGSPDLSTTATAASHVAASPYTISVADAGSLSAANYSFPAADFVNASLTVTPAPLTLGADDQTTTYGGTLPALTYTATGLVNGDSATSLTTQPTLSTVSASSHVGTYDITAAGASDPDYNISYQKGMLTIAPANLTIAANNQSMTYGGDLPALTYTATGLVNGDTTASLTTQPTLSTAPASSHAGSYDIAAAGASDPDYNISYQTGTLTINPANLTITANDQTMAYGGTLPALTYTATGLVNGDTTASLATQPTLSTAPATSHAGAYAITASGASDSDYAISYAPGTLTVTPAPLTITAADQTMTYGGALPALTYTATGLVNGDTSASLTTQPTLATAPATSHAGTYDITASDASDPDYNISYQKGTLTISAASLTITANNQTMTYGGAPPMLAYTATGLVNGDTTASLTTQPTLATAPATSHAGTYDITASDASDPDYNISYQKGTLTISAANLTITANDQSMTYGGTLPTLTYTATGLVNGDTSASLTTQPTLATAPATSHAGAYAITAGGASDPDYAISYAPGTLTVTPADASPMVAPYSVTFDGNRYTATASATDINGKPLPASDFTLSGTTHTNAGSYSDNWSFSDPSGNYLPASGTVDDLIKQASANPTVTAYSVTYDGFNHTAVRSATDVNGNPLPASDFTLAATTHINAGTYNGDAWSFSDPSGNYLPASGTVDDLIKQASANPAVTAYSVTYDGFSHTALRLASDVNGNPLPASDFTLTGTTHTNAGSYSDAWSFSDPSGNYLSASGAVDDLIKQASANPGVTAYSVTYDGFNHTALRSASDVNGNPLPASDFTLAATTHTNAGSYSDNWSFSDPSGNYLSASGTVSDSIAPAALTITANNQNMRYGAALPMLTVTYAGFVNGETPASLTTPPTVSTTATASSAAGTYPITASGAVDANYAISYLPGTLMVTPAPLTITAANRTIVYGGSLPALTYTATGLVNGDTTASLATQPTLSTVSASSHVGTYAITAGGASDPDYVITYAPATLTVTPANLTITANDKAMTYGGTLPALTYTATGLVNGDTTASLSTQPTLSTAPAGSHAGSYDIAAAGASDADYAISYAPGTLTVTPAPLTITAANQTMTYGGTLPALTYTATGLVNGDTTASLSTQPTLSTAPATSHAGTYDITAGDASDPDYNISYRKGTLTISAASLTITANNQTMTYGGTLPTLTYTATGLVNGDTTASLTAQPTLSTAPATSHAGAYAITAGGASDPDYAISYAPGTLTVTPAPLTITAADQTMTYGGSLPALTYTATGLVNGDTVASLTVQPTLATAPANSHAGSYDITAAGASDPDYTITYAPGTLAITPANLTITAANQTMTYGGILPALTYTATGLVNGDTTAGLTTQPTLSTVAAGSHVGTYAITVGGASDPDYVITYAPGTLTVTPANLTITANDQTMTYGGTLPSLNYTAAGLVNGDTTASLTTQPTLATAPATSHAGTYDITAGDASDPDYNISYQKGTLTISAASLTITANNQTMTYGGTLPTLTYTATGLVNGDTTASLTAQPTLSTAPATSHAGAYAITAGGASDPDYAISYAPGTLTVTPAPLTITAADQTMTYGGTLPTLTYTATGLVNGDTVASLTVQPTLATAPASSHAGSYAITAAGASDPDYNITYQKGTLTINPANLVIAANNQSMTYGGSLPALTYTATGLVNGDTTARLATQPNLSTAPATSHAGAYAITVGGASDPDYAISYAPGTLTVTPAPLMITAANQTMTYGGSLPALTYTATGLVNGDTAASLTVQPTLATAPASSHAGSYAITAIGASDPDYNISYHAGMLTINPASLVIAASNQSMTYGGTLPALTYTATGLVNGDTTASLTTPPALSTAPATSHAGAYAITAGGASDSDYAISYAPGTLTVTPAPLTITAANQTITYGGSLPALTYTATGLVNGDTTASLTTQPTLSTVSASSHVGSYAITASGASDLDYTITYALGTLTITPAASATSVGAAAATYGDGTVTLRAAVGDNTPGSVAAVNEGTVTFTLLDAAGNVVGSPVTAPVSNGTASAGYALGAAVKAGTYTIRAVYNPTVSGADFTASTGSSTLTVGKAQPALSASAPASVLVHAASVAFTGTLNYAAPVGQLVPTGQVVATLYQLSPSGALTALATATVTPKSDGTFAGSFDASRLAAGSYRIGYAYAGDANFLTASAASDFAVTYGTNVLTDLSKPKKGGTPLPINLQVTDAAGANLSSASLAVTALGISPASATDVTMPAASQGNANPGGAFQFLKGGGGSYQFNLLLTDPNGKALAAGAYTFYYQIAGDPLVHTLGFLVN